MNRSVFKENGEQGFPYILPVLRSYKQSLMFASKEENSYDLELPEINQRFGPDLIHSSPRKNRRKTKKITMNKTLRKNTVNFKYSPHFNIPTGRHSLVI